VPAASMAYMWIPNSCFRYGGPDWGTVKIE
jgi:hypothetical protein